MARRRYRYIVIKVTFQDSKRFEIPPGVSLNIIRDSLQLNYGEKLVSEFQASRIHDYLPAHGISVVQIARGTTPQVLSSLVLCGSLESFPCNIAVLFVSGSLKNARKKIVKYMGEEGDKCK
jgi:RNase P/RNase MRP subunit POP5